MVLSNFFSAIQGATSSRGNTGVVTNPEESVSSDWVYVTDAIQDSHAESDTGQSDIVAETDPPRLVLRQRNSSGDIDQRSDTQIGDGPSGTATPSTIAMPTSAADTHRRTGEWRVYRGFTTSTTRYRVRTVTHSTIGPCYHQINDTLYSRDQIYAVPVDRHGQFDWEDEMCYTGEPADDKDRAVLEVIAARAETTAIASDFEAASSCTHFFTEQAYISDQRTQKSAPIPPPGVLSNCRPLTDEEKAEWHSSRSSLIFDAYDSKRRPSPYWQRSRGFRDSDMGEWTGAGIRLEEDFASATRQRETAWAEAARQREDAARQCEAASRQRDAALTAAARQRVAADRQRDAALAAAARQREAAYRQRDAALAAAARRRG